MPFRSPLRYLGKHLLVHRAANRKKIAAMADKAFVFASISAISHKNAPISAFFRPQTALFVIMHLCLGGTKHTEACKGVAFSGLKTVFSGDGSSQYYQRTCGFGEW